MTRIWPLLLALALFPGCKKPAPPEPAEKRERPLADDGTTARHITMLPDKVKVQSDLAFVRGAIRIYKGEKDAWPASLEELSLSGINYPQDLTYAPASGEVKSLTYPGY